MIWSEFDRQGLTILLHLIDLKWHSCSKEFASLMEQILSRKTTIQGAGSKL